MNAGSHPVAQIFKAFQAHGLLYAVLRNAERALSFPQEGDLDIVVPRGESGRAQAIAATALAQSGWSTLRAYRKHHRMRHVLFVGPSRAQPEAIRLDLIEAIGWGPFSLQNSESVIARSKMHSAGFFHVSDADAAACALADGVLFPGSIKRRYLQSIQETLDSEPVSRVCSALFGGKSGQFKEVLKGEVEQLGSWRKMARRRLALGLVCRVQVLSRLFWVDLLFFIATLFGRLVYPPGWVLELAADENVEEIKKELRGLVSEVEVVERRLSLWALYKRAIKGQGVIVKKGVIPRAWKGMLRGVVKSSVAGVWEAEQAEAPPAP